MPTQDQASPSHFVVHRHIQRQFDKHRDKFDKHRRKGKAFAEALDAFEKRLFKEV